MKKIFIIITSIILLFISIYLLTYKENNNLKKIKVAEVAHSIFYIPWYISNGMGYFNEEGLDVEIILTPGADKVSAAVLSGDVDIGFCGSEATIYIYNGGEKDYLVNFAGLTKRDGSFIVSREKYDNFTLNDLINKKIIGGRAGGMPEMTLEWTLKENGINISDVNIDTSIAFQAMSGAFIGGEGDFVSLFEPNAIEIEKNGYGYVVESLGKLGGEVPYTTFNAKKSYIENNKETIKKFNNALNKGLDYTYSHTPKEIALVISKYFPDTDIIDLEKIVKRYIDNDSWYKNTNISEKDFNHVQDIMENANQLDKKVEYDKLVVNL